MINVSIVSHGHASMIDPLIDQLLGCPEIGTVLVTHNIPEAGAINPRNRVMVLHNQSPKGFGANHNAAFIFLNQNAPAADTFLVLNPDISIEGNPFPALLDCLQQTGAVLAGPLVLSPLNGVEDSARTFPSLLFLIRKALRGFRSPMADGNPAQDAMMATSEPDWLAGMFMLFTSEGYRALGGFDERYFLYYEDVDLCARIWKSGQRLVFCPEARVIHDAQRASHRKLRFFLWHLSSLIRFLLTHGGFKRSTR